MAGHSGEDSYSAARMSVTGAAHGCGLCAVPVTPRSAPAGRACRAAAALLSASLGVPTGGVPRALRWLCRPV